MCNWTLEFHESVREAILLCQEQDIVLAPAGFRLLLSGVHQEHSKIVLLSGEVHTICIKKNCRAA